MTIKSLHELHTQTIFEKEKKRIRKGKCKENKHELYSDQFLTFCYVNIFVFVLFLFCLVHCLFDCLGQISNQLLLVTRGKKLQGAYH